MAERLSTRSEQGRTSIITIAGLLDGDTSEALILEDHDNLSVQVIGTLSVGGEYTIQGSNDGGVNWATLSDGVITPLVFTALGIHAIHESVGMYRILISGGDGSTDLTAIIHVQIR